MATGASRDNGQVERVMGTLKKHVCNCKDDRRISRELLKNCTTNRVTNSCPLELIIGRTARPSDLLLPEFLFFS